MGNLFILSYGPVSMDEDQTDKELAQAAEVNRDLTNLNRLGALTIELATFYHHLKFNGYNVDSLTKSQFQTLYRNDSLNSSDV